MKGKLGDIAQFQIEHLQYHTGQIGTLQFRFSKSTPAFEVFLRIQPDTDARLQTSAATFTLVRRWLD